MAKNEITKDVLDLMCHCGNTMQVSMICVFLVNVYVSKIKWDGVLRVP